MPDVNQQSDPDLVAMLSPKVLPSWRSVSFHVDYVARLAAEGYVSRETLEAFVRLLEASFRKPQRQLPRD